MSREQKRPVTCDGRQLFGRDVLVIPGSHAWKKGKPAHRNAVKSLLSSRAIDTEKVSKKLLHNLSSSCPMPHLKF